MDNLAQLAEAVHTTRPSPPRTTAQLLHRVGAVLMADGFAVSVCPGCVTIATATHRWRLTAIDTDDPADLADHVLAPIAETPIAATLRRIRPICGGGGEVMADPDFDPELEAALAERFPGRAAGREWRGEATEAPMEAVFGYE